jgi:hypothetical protein
MFAVLEYAYQVSDSDVSPGVTSQRLVLLDLSVFGYLAFKDSLPSSTS